MEYSRSPLSNLFRLCLLNYDVTMEKSEIYAALNIVSILVTILGIFMTVIINSTNFSDYDRRRYQHPSPATYSRPTLAIQNEQPIVMHEPYTHDFQIQPTGVEHDRPVIAGLSLTNDSNQIQTGLDSSVRSGSSVVASGAYQLIVRRSN